MNMQASPQVMNDNVPRRDWRRLLATSDRFHVVSHVYLAAAGIVFALDGWWVMTAFFVAIFVLATVLGTFQSINAEIEQKYEGCRKELDERQQGPQSWSA
jgi:hypothetical protein